MLHQLYKKAEDCVSVTSVVQEGRRLCVTSVVQEGRGLCVTSVVQEGRGLCKCYISCTRRQRIV